MLASVAKRHNHLYVIRALELGFEGNGLATMVALGCISNVDLSGLKNSSCFIIIKEIKQGCVSVLKKTIQFQFHFHCSIQDASFLKLFEHVLNKSFKTDTLRYLENRLLKETFIPVLE